MIWGIFIFVIIIITVLFLLYKIVQIIGVLALGVLFICLTSVLYISTAVAGGLLFVLFEQFGGKNFGLLTAISIAVAVLVGAGLLSAMVKEATEGKEKAKKWLGRS
jgi:amino acid permease